VAEAAGAPAGVKTRRRKRLTLITQIYTNFKSRGGSLDVQDITVQEQLGVEILVLGGFRNIALLRQVGEKGFDLRRAYLGRVAGETLFRFIEVDIALRLMKVFSVE
jgi:hypothetical protein